MRNLSNQGKITEVEELYEQAKELGVSVYGFSMPRCRAVSYMNESGDCAIGIDSSRSYTASEVKTMLAHELGHCSTGAFYNQYTPFSLRSKCERKADEWAILRCVPQNQLISACKSGLSSSYELAEYFGVSESMMKKAIEYYIQRSK